jgi:four helix bundle protein
MRIQRFEELISWQKAKNLYVELDGIFRNEKDYFFKDQVLRATLSISNNIAEGFDRKSDNELRQFLVIARGSCAEVRSMMYVAEAVGKINTEESVRYINDTDEISRLITGFIKKLVTNDKRLETYT